MTTLPWSGRTGAVLLALLLGGGLGAEEGFAPISPSQIRAGRFRPGERRSITGKYQELINREIRLYGIEARLLLGHPNLGRQLLEFKAQKDNLTLLGRFQDRGGGEGEEEGDLPLFEVERIKPAPPDAELYQKKLQDLLQEPGRSPEGLLELLEEIAGALRRFGDPGLPAVAKRAAKEAHALAEALLPGEDAGGRLEVIRRVHAALEDQDLTVELLRAQVKRFPGHAPTLDLLRALKCTQMGGEWLTYPDFKRRLGFVWRRERWVKPARKELLDTVEALQALNHTNLILRHRTDREYKVLARGGKVEKGMSREELTEALGFPDRVERELREGMEVDQWVYGERRVYLLNGQVAAAPP
jgi:hypothetical protein